MSEVKIFKEIELSTHEADTWGHLDLLVLRGRQSDVFDWKYGFGEV